MMMTGQEQGSETVVCLHPLHTRTYTHMYVDIDINTDIDKSSLVRKYDYGG